MKQQHLKLVTLFLIMFMSFQPRAFANHSAVIDISPQTYSVMLYIFIIVGILLIAGIIMIWKQTKKIKQQKKDQQPFERTVQTRMFFILATIMAAIGFVSAGFFYFIISAMVKH